MRTVHGDEYIMESIYQGMRRVTRNGEVCPNVKQQHIGGFWTGSKQWELKVWPGTDPVLMVAFMAIYDEFVDAAKRREP